MRADSSSQLWAFLHGRGFSYRTGQETSGLLRANPGSGLLINSVTAAHTCSSAPTGCPRSPSSRMRPGRPVPGEPTAQRGRLSSQRRTRARPPAPSVPATLLVCSGDVPNPTPNQGGLGPAPSENGDLGSWGPGPAKNSGLQGGATQRPSSGCRRRGHLQASPPIP